MTSDNPIVFVVDDDYRIREALSSLIASVGLRVAAFGSAAEFLEAGKPDAPACLVLDLQLPGPSGLELQRELSDGTGPPIIFITGHGDIPSSVRAMKAGAIEFLPKPFGDEELPAAIDAALAADRKGRRERAELSELQKHYALLTPREREVMPFVTAGLANKQTAAELGTSEITIGVALRYPVFADQPIGLPQHIHNVLPLSFSQRARRRRWEVAASLAASIRSIRLADRDPCNWP